MSGRTTKIRRYPLAILFVLSLAAARGLVCLPFYCIYTFRIVLLSLALNRSKNRIPGTLECKADEVLYYASIAQYNLAHDMQHRKNELKKQME